MAQQLNVPIREVVQSGTGLAFVAYPEALSRMPLSWYAMFNTHSINSFDFRLWAFLFFTMIWILGLSTQFGYGEIMIGALSEQFPRLLDHKAITTFSICGFLYCCGLILCTRSGIFFFNILNDYSSSFSLELVICFEAIIMCYIYGNFDSN
jgi:solute carrier family 6 amino acid transporter-like protein 5/7/9/14